MPLRTRRRRYFVPGTVPAGGVRLNVWFPVPVTDFTVWVSFVSSTSPSPFQSTHHPKRADVNVAVFRNTRTVSVVVDPTVNAGMMRSSSSRLLKSSVVPFPLVGLEASASVAFVPM